MLKAFLYSWIVMLVAVFTSCEPDWDFDSDYESEVVVEGGITVDGFAKVYLSQSKILNSTWDSIALSKLPVMSAKVTVSDGSQTEILVGRIDKGRLPYFVYTGSQIRGEVGKVYTLTVMYRGKEITAHTTIPEPILLDSIRLRPTEGVIRFIRLLRILMTRKVKPTIIKYSLKWKRKMRTIIMRLWVRFLMRY